MPRNMSFIATVDQVRDRSKTVTRRLGWSFLLPGEVLTACVKCQGLKKGEKIEKLAEIKIVSVRSEPLGLITPGDVIREGFDEMTTRDFIDLFCRINPGCTEDSEINRIEFLYRGIYQPVKNGAQQFTFDI